MTSLIRNLSCWRQQIFFFFFFLQTFADTTRGTLPQHPTVIYQDNHSLTRLNYFQIHFML